MELESMEVGNELSNSLEIKETEWLQQRRGMLTASKFGDLIGTGRAKDAEFTQAGYSYLRLKIAERLGSFHTFKSQATEWGKSHEAEAINQYAKRKEVEVDSEPYRFIRFNEDIGGTPDGLVGEDGCLEVKVPWNPTNHVETLLTQKVPAIYEWQVQGHLLVTGRDWCDFVSFDPRMDGIERLVVVRVERNSHDLASLMDRLEAGVAYIDRWMRKLMV